jgi:cytochrome c biogenesis protein
MDTQPPVRADYIDALWRFFASLKLTVIILLTLAVLAGVGTFLPQNQNPADYFRAFGPFWYQILATLDLFDLYHAWWFRLLIMALVVNIIICSVDRLQTTWKIIFIKPADLNLDQFRSRKARIAFQVTAPPDRLQETIGRQVKKFVGSFRTFPADQGFAMAVDKGRWTRLGVYVVHLSVIVLLIGGLVGSMLGFEGYVNIPEDETIQAIELRNSGLPFTLPFTLRCDDFKMQVYDTGAPKEWRVWLTILENDRPVAQKDIIVNDPLRYKGINIFLSSYGKLKEPTAPTMAAFDPEQEIRLNFQSRASGMIYDKRVRINDIVELPEGQGTLVVKSFETQGEFKGVEIGPTLTAELTPASGGPETIFLPLSSPKFDAMRRGALIISAVAKLPEQETRYYAGLQITRDPGVGLVYTGFILMIAGCFISFFMSHQQIVVEVRGRGDHSEVMVAGTANKNKLGLEAKLARLADRLKEL